MAAPLVVYGAYGYTGRLVVAELLARGLRPVLSGRDPARLAAMAQETGCEANAVRLSNRAALEALLAPAAGVLHCAGPFSETAAMMRDACCATGTHYVDITGEPAVLAASLASDAQARAAGIMVLSGGGFDIVPTDCLAVMLKDRLPDATELRLAFTTSGGASRGTMRTASRMLAEPVMVRRGGAVVPRTDQSPVTIDFGGGPRPVTPATWGDVITAQHSTGIDTVEEFIDLPPESRKIVGAPWILRRFLASRLGRGVIEKTLSRMPEGPNERQRREGRALVYGRARNPAGDVVELRLRTAETYHLTGLAMAEIGARILNGDAPTGAQTPSTAYGAGFVLALEGSALIAD